MCYRLGAVHDGSPPPSYLGGPGAEKCQWTDGYIMSDLRHTERGFRWSPCSVSSFHHFLKWVTVILTKEIEKIIWKLNAPTIFFNLSPPNRNFHFYLLGKNEVYTKNATIQWKKKKEWKQK